MSNEMIERCALAVASCSDMQKLAKHNPEAYTAAVGIVKICIAAMREPTEVMIEATDPVDKNEWQYVLETWQSMIDEVLK